MCYLYFFVSLLSHYYSYFWLLDSRLSGLFTQVPRSLDIQGLTVLWPMTEDAKKFIGPIKTERIVISIAVGWAGHDRLYFWLIEKVAHVFLNQSLSVVMKNQVNANFFQHSFWQVKITLYGKNQ